MIQSLSNPQIKNLIQLQKKAKVRNEQDVFVVEGIKMFFEAKRESIVKAYASESFYKDALSNNIDYFKGYEIEILDDSVFKEVSDTKTPQGIMAIVSKPKYKIEDIVLDAKANLIILEDIRDPGNLGTIIRTSEGAGITGIIISKESVDIYNPKVIRSTMGSIYRMPFVYVEDMINTVKILKENKITLFAAHLGGEKYYDEEDYSGKCGVLIGNEANGLSNEISNLADKLVKIPMSGHVESLNAAIAAAVLMYEVFKQKR